MRRQQIGPALTAAAAAALALAPARAQDLGMVEQLFEEVSAVTVFYQVGGVPASPDVGSDGLLQGAGTEVLINLRTTGATEFELGLGASYLRGYVAAEPSLDLRTSLRALPTVSLYASRSLSEALSGYLGGSFGMVELWNARAYEPSGNAWDLEARTFELGASLGLYLGIADLPGVFAEAGWRIRQFPSVKWTPVDEGPLPAEWPRSLDFSGYYVSAGLQIRLDEGDAADAAQSPISPPAPAGTWMLERVDGAPVPAFFDSTAQGRREVVHGVLRLAPDTAAAAAAAGVGTWSLELDTRERGGLRTATDPAVRLASVQASGRFTTHGGVLVLNREGASAPAGRAERLAGRLYVRWNGHVLVFAPGSTAPGTP